MSTGFIEKESCECQVRSPSVVHVTPDSAFIFSVMKIIISRAVLKVRNLRGIYEDLSLREFPFLSAWRGRVLGAH